MCSDDRVCFKGASGLNVRKNKNFESEIFEEIPKFSEGGKMFHDVIYCTV